MRLFRYPPSNIVRNVPRREDPFTSVFDLMESSFFDFPDTSVWRKYGVKDLPLDIKENDHSYTVEVDIPGLTKEDLKVEAHGKVLTISYEHKQDEDVKDAKYHRMERYRSSASRSVRLPKNADLEQVEASASDGVLRISVPKLQKSDDEGKKVITIK